MRLTQQTEQTRDSEKPKLSERELEIMNTALDHARLMNLGPLETNLLLLFTKRVFYSGKVEGMDVVKGIIQRYEKETEPTDFSQD